MHSTPVACTCHVTCLLVYSSGGLQPGIQLFRVVYRYTAYTPLTAPLAEVYSSTAVYIGLQYTALQRSTVYSGIHSPSEPQFHVLRDCSTSWFGAGLEQRTMKAEVRSCPATCPMLAIQPHCAQPCLTTMPAARFKSSRASPPPPSACARPAHVPLLCESSAQKCAFLRRR